MEEEAKNRAAQWEISASGAMDHLKAFAQRRTDIFGSGDIETEIGRRVSGSPPFFKASKAR